MAARVDRETDLKARLDAAMESAKSRDIKAEKILIGAIALNALLGTTPIVSWIHVIIVVVMVILIGNTYGFARDRHHIAVLIRQSLVTAAATYGGVLIGMLFIVNVLQVGYADPMGNVLVTGLLGALPPGIVTFALGYTTKMYFARGCPIDRDVIRTAFSTSDAEQERRRPAAKSERG